MIYLECRQAWGIGFALWPGRETVGEKGLVPMPEAAEQLHAMTVIGTKRDPGMIERGMVGGIQSSTWCWKRK